MEAGVRADGSNFAIGAFFLRFPCRGRKMKCHEETKRLVALAPDGMHLLIQLLLAAALITGVAGLRQMKL